MYILITSVGTNLVQANIISHLSDAVGSSDSLPPHTQYRRQSGVRWCPSAAQSAQYTPILFRPRPLGPPDLTSSPVLAPALSPLLSPPQHTGFLASLTHLSGPLQMLFPWPKMLSGCQCDACISSGVCPVVTCEACLTVFVWKGTISLLYSLSPSVEWWLHGQKDVVCFVYSCLILGI